MCAILSKLRQTIESGMIPGGCLICLYVECENHRNYYISVLAVSFTINIENKIRNYILNECTTYYQVDF